MSASVVVTLWRKNQLRRMPARCMRTSGTPAPPFGSGSVTIASSSRSRTASVKQVADCSASGVRRATSLATNRLKRSVSMPSCTVA